MKQALAVITAQKNDLSRLMETLPQWSVTYILPEEIATFDFSQCAALALLGGTGEKPLMLEADARLRIEEQIRQGKRVFSEYLISIDDVYTPDPISTRFRRLVVNRELPGLAPGDLLDEQCNSFVRPHFSKKAEEPLLYYQEFVNAHDHTTVSDGAADISNWALWMERPNLMICSFRLCNFNQARFAPLQRWRDVIRFILEWLTGEPAGEWALKPAYTLVPDVEKGQMDDLLQECFASGIRWLHRSGILLENGKRGVYEGLMTEIYPDGSQAVATCIRTDCTAEVSLAFFTDYLLNGNEQSLAISDALESFCYDKMQITGGVYDGMLRWTNVAWNVCYQDDCARVLIPSLLKMMYTGNRQHLSHCCRALDFLLQVTGTDGLRPSRIDLMDLDAGEMRRLRQNPGAFPCAHYNAFYSAALLLCGKLADRADFVETGIRGLESLMAAYPQTVREQSETEELCRLVLPLSWLYWATGEPEHREYLYRVTKDLQRLKHPNGGYLEWDSDYSAVCSRKENAECSLLTQNGDPVVDLLYSVNWLPMGFLHAYQITGDPFFHNLWQEIASFLIRAQIHSDNPQIDGGWARGFDVEKMEVFGLPNDVGWGPWAMESGWTISEILAGLGLGIYPENIFQNSLK